MRRASTIGIHSAIQEDDPLSARPPKVRAVPSTLRAARNKLHVAWEMLYMAEVHVAAAHRTFKEAPKYEDEIRKMREQIGQMGDSLALDLRKMGAKIN